MKKENKLYQVLIFAFILLAGTGLFFWKAVFFDEKSTIYENIDRYKSGFNYGYEIGFKDGLDEMKAYTKKLNECKSDLSPKIEDCLWVFLIEDFGFTIFPEDAYDKYHWDWVF